MKSSVIGAGLALLLLGACGRGENNPNQPTSEERQKLDNIAAKADEAETFDTSADSLVLNEGAADAADAQSPQPANGSAPATGNAASVSTNQR